MMKVSVTVSDELHEELKDYAYWKGEMTIASLIRLAVKHYVRQYPKTDQKQSKPRKTTLQLMNTGRVD